MKQQLSSREHMPGLNLTITGSGVWLYCSGETGWDMEERQTCMIKDKDHP